MPFDALWSELDPIGRARSGGYRRFAWTDPDRTLREWFAAAAIDRGLDVHEDRNGNQFAWWGDPDTEPGVVTGSHLDSVPDGGAFDGPLGVVAALCAVEQLKTEGFQPSRPIAVANFVDEEGARFGIACLGSRLLTGAIEPKRALALTDADGITLAEANPRRIGRDDEALRRIGVMIELHVEQGRHLDRPVGIASSIWPHGRWRADLPGEANHAGTTGLDDRHDPMLAYARLVLKARQSAAQHHALATCGKIRVQPNGVNAIPSEVTGWVDVRGPDEYVVRAVVADLHTVVHADRGALTEESWTGTTTFDPDLAGWISRLLDDAPILATGAGHDAGILAAHGIPAAMLFVRNPTGVSHSPAEFAERDDCLAGVAALTTVIRDLAA